MNKKNKKFCQCVIKLQTKIQITQDHHLRPLAQAVKSYIKDTNEILKKLRSLPKLPDGIILCTMDAVGLYPNIPYEEGLSALRERLETRKENHVSNDTIIDLAEVVLKNNIFTFGKKTLTGDCYWYKICTSV